MNGVFFDLRTIRARDLAALNAAVLHDGRVFGCDLTFNNAVLTISTGYILACGRLIEIENDTSIPADNSTGYGRLKLVINLTDAASAETFTQGMFVWEYSTSTSFPSLIKQNINDGANTSYEMEICRVTFSNSQIAAITSQMPTATCKDFDGLTPASIGAAKAPVDRSVNLSATWTGSTIPYSQTVSVTGVTASNPIQVGIAPNATATQLNAAIKAKLHCTAQANGTITVKAFGTKPTVQIPLIVRILG